MSLLLKLLAFTFGALMPIQVGINASLRVLLRDPFLAGLANMVVGASVIIALLLVLRVPLPAPAAIASVPLWGWLGGAIGAGVVVVSLVAGPKLGAATLFVLIVAGQVAGSLVLDHFGFMGYPVRPLTVLRIAGALLLIVGVILIVRN
jgi:transporter family-2 protein